MTVIVIGCKGMLAQDIISRLKNADNTVIGFDLPELDITRSQDIMSVLKAHKHRFVVNCAAYTAVDRAESEPETAFAVNRDGAANLAQACQHLRIPLIYISTDFVFNGFKKSPYLEDDSANPLSVYGRSKWEGEEAVRSNIANHIIVRTSWLYGVHGNNFVKTMLRLARERDEISVVDDQTGCPTWTGDLADALVKIIHFLHDNPVLRIWGTYHFCGSGNTTWYGFTKAIIDVAQKYDSLKVKKIIPISTEQYPTAAQRPKWSVLDTAKISSIFGIQPMSWEKGLSEMMQKLYE